MTDRNGKAGEEWRSLPLHPQVYDREKFIADGKMIDLSDGPFGDLGQRFGWSAKMGVSARLYATLLEVKDVEEGWPEASLSMVLRAARGLLERGHIAELGERPETRFFTLMTDGKFYHKTGMLEAGRTFKGIVLLHTDKDRNICCTILMAGEVSGSGCIRN